MARRSLVPALLGALLAVTAAAAHPMLDDQLVHAEAALAAAPADAHAWERVAQLHR